MTCTSVNVGEIYDFIDSVAPFDTAMSFDNAGLLVGSRNRAVSSILCTLDITNDSVREAERVGADLIVSHHPVIFDPLKNIDSNSVVYKLCRSEISAICAHTNLDAAYGGVNDVLCSLLRLCNIEVWEPEKIGRIGFTDCTFPEFLKNAVEKIGCTSANYVQCSDNVKKVAVIGGSGGGEIDLAIASGADTLVTGEMKHSQYIEAKAKGLNVITAGHFDTEFPVIPVLAAKLTEKFPSLSVSVFKELAYSVYTK